MRYVYVDESIFAEPKACIGTGMLITDDEIPKSLIDDAISALRNDPDRHKKNVKKLDDNTLARSYFHASEDSGNSHSHLITAINKNINGEFVCDFHDTTIPRQATPDVDYLKMSFVNNTIAAIQKRDKVSFIVEGRASLNASDLKATHCELEKHLVQTAYDMPALPLYFPETSFSIVDKSNPGVQCCDFLLWVVNRRVNGETIWYNRIRSRIRSSFKDDADLWGGDNIPLGKGLIEPPLNYGPFDFPIESDSKNSRDLMVKYLLQAVYVCEYYSKYPNPIVAHFQKEIDLVQSLKYDDSRSDYLDLLFGTYIKLFDMVNIVQPDMSKDDKEFLLMSKKYGSLALRRDLIHGMNTRQWLIRVRRDMLNNNKKLFEFKDKNSEASAP